MPLPLILLTNDDGIESPGLAAAAAALSPLGELLIVAPATQQTSMGRSRSERDGRDGRVIKTTVRFENQSWEGYGVQATPALAVEYGLQALATRPVSLVVSGINDGENIGTCVTVSGTIGAALEGAERGLRAIALSLATDEAHYYEHDQSHDFRPAMHFAHFFAARALGPAWPPDVDVLKIEIPSTATADTGWRVTRQDRLAYYQPVLLHPETEFDQPKPFAYPKAQGKFIQEDTDAFALAHGLVSVTPLSIDLTSRVALREVQALFDPATT